jgi:hypothetical protein
MSNFNQTEMVTTFSGEIVEVFKKRLVLKNNNYTSNYGGNN